KTGRPSLKGHLYRTFAFVYLSSFTRFSGISKTSESKGCKYHFIRDPPSRSLDVCCRSSRTVQLTPFPRNSESSACPDETSDRPQVSSSRTENPECPGFDSALAASTLSRT